MEKKTNRGGARPGSGRKKGSLRGISFCKKVQIRLNKEQLELVEKTAKERGLKLSTFCKAAVLNNCENH